MSLTSIPWDIALGGITGLVGTIFSAWNQRKLKQMELDDKKAERSHQLAVIAADTEAMKAEAEASIKVSEVQTSGAITLQEAKLYDANLKAANKPSLAMELAAKLFEQSGWRAVFCIPAGVTICMLFGIIDTIKGIMRPGITAYLLGLSTWLSYQAWKVLAAISATGAVLSVDQATGLLQTIISAVLYLTTTSVTWWFGDRMAAKGAANLVAPVKTA